MRITFPGVQAARRRWFARISVGVVVAIGVAALLWSPLRETGHDDDSRSKREASASTTSTYPLDGATLRDDFTTLDAARWTAYPPSDVTVANGQLRVTTAHHYPSAAAPSSTEFPYSLERHDFTFQLVGTPDPGNGSTEVYTAFQSQDSRDQRQSLVAWKWSNNELYATYFDHGDESSVHIGTWSPSTFAYLRLRGSDGSVHWDSSSDGSAWVTRRSLATSALHFRLDAGYLWLSSGFWGDERVATFAAWDNVSLLPAE